MAIEVMINVRNDAQKTVNVDLFLGIEKDQLDDMADPDIEPIWIESIKKLKPGHIGVIKKDIEAETYELSAYASRKGVMSKDARKIDVTVDELHKNFNFSVTDNEIQPLNTPLDKVVLTAAKKVKTGKKKAAKRDRSAEL
jgi:hypothetical protein